MGQERDTRMVYIKDLLFVALYQWRNILLVSLVFAVVLAGVAGAMEWKSFSAAQGKTIDQATLDAYAEEKEILQNNVSYIQDTVDNQKAYLEESVLMDLDPYNVYKALVVFSVETDYQIQPEMTYQNPDNILTILNSYGVFLTSNQVIDSIAEEMGMKSKYVDEIVTVTNGGTGLRNLIISVTHSNAEDAAKITDLMVSFIDDAAKSISQTVGDHRIEMISCNVCEQIDLSVETARNNAIIRLNTLTQNLTDAQNALDALTLPETEAKFSAIKVIIFAVAGIVLGAMLVIGVACLKHIAGGKVYSVRTLKNRFDIKVLCCVPSSKKRTPMDCWLRKLENRSMDKEQFVLAAATIKNYCQNAQNLMIVADEEMPIQPLLDALKNCGTEISACGSLLHSVKALEALPKADAILMVAQCDKTRYDYMEHELGLIADQGKQLLGCVLIDG